MSNNQFLINPSGVNSAWKIASGTWTTASAADTVTVSGLRTVLAATVSLVDDPTDDPEWVSVAFDPTAAPQPIGQDTSITIKTWKNTSGTDPTPAAATTFNKRTSWIAVGF
jgi:hypothetical protein